MPHVAMDNLTDMQKYWLITGSVGPRPIALVTSLDGNGNCNAAPYSALNYMGEDPPLLVIAIDSYGEESHRPGATKDTLNNIERAGEFVVNMVDETIADRMVLCGTDYPAHMSEAEAVGFELTPSATIRVPRIADTPIAWECKLFELLSFSKKRTIVFGEIVSMYFREDMLDQEKLRVNVDRFMPYGRLGGPNYCRSTDRVVLRVPIFLASAGKPRE